MNRTERLQEVLKLEGIAAAATTRAQYYREELAFDARDELAREGSAPTWRMPDLATVTLAVSKEVPYVKDEDALLKWCKTQYPDHVETVEKVLSSFRAHLLVRSIVSGDTVVDENTGEIIPGLGVRPGGQPGSLSIRASHAARAVFTALGEKALEDILTATRTTIPADGAQMVPDAAA